MKRFPTYKFTPHKKHFLTFPAIKEIIKAFNKGVSCLEITLDLGKTVSTIKFEEFNVVFPDDAKIHVEILRKVKDERAVYGVNPTTNSLFKVSFSKSNSFYKLVSIGKEEAPTLEINGIHMHQIKKLTPWQDSKKKVSAAQVRRGSKVLDIGTGLGYTAILSFQKSLCEVLTIEKDRNVLEIAEYNPWSWPLANQEIKILNGDASKEIKKFEDEYFDRIIHDPPRFSLAGELYSLDFYRELYRVLARGGKLFHYTGEPRRRGGRSVIVKGVSGRLKKAGFKVERIKETQGFLCYK